jgi:glycogen(starch) synthase
VLLTDVFPPRSGGSGWSTFYLGKSLAERGHGVRILRPDWDSASMRPALRMGEYEGMPVEWVQLPPTPDWAVKAGLGTAWRERQATDLMAKRAVRLAIAGQADVLHGQHKASASATSIAVCRARSKGARIVSVATVRDYWPLCPASTRLFTRGDGTTFECRSCHRLPDYLRCCYAGRRSPLGMSLSLARWLATRRASRLLAACDATIAVSRYVRAELAMSGRVPREKLVSIPNLVHIPSVGRALSAPWPLHDISPQDRYALFVGKLDTNKGAHYLPETMQGAALDMPLVLAGDGPLRSHLEEAARSKGLDFRFHDWLDNDAILRLMHSATLLLFPSAWQEPLSRVLLEACAASAAIVAMNTGGTGDIIEHGESGWLVGDVTELIEGARMVASDHALNAHLRSGARRQAETTFSSDRVAGQVEQLYSSLLTGLQNPKSKIQNLKSETE